MYGKDYKWIIGIDLGSKLGYAVLTRSGEHYTSGVWDCSRRKGEGVATRFIRFEQLLRTLFETFPGSFLTYEKVAPYGSNDAKFVYYGLQTRLLAVVEELEVPYLGVSPAAIKKAATGKGNADKTAMLQAARERWGDMVDKGNEKTADESDALHIAEYGRTHLSS